MHRQRRYTYTLLCSVIVLIGFGVRLIGLGAESLWYDETVSAFLARQAIPALIAHTARDIHPPGYYLLLHAWTSWAGYSEFALAFHSLVWGIVLAVLACRLARHLLGESAAVWALVFVTLSPFNIWYSQEVRMYTLAAALGLLAVWRSLAMLGGRGLAVAGYVLAAAAGLYVLYYFAFLLIALSGGVVIWLAYRCRWQRLGVWVAAQVAVLVLYAPWLPIAWRQATEPPVPPWRSPTPVVAAVLETWTALTSGQAVPAAPVWPVLATTGALFVCGAIGATAAGWHRAEQPVNRGNATILADAPNPGLLLATILIGPLALIALASLVTPLYHVRYVFTYAAAFYILLGAGVVWLRRRRRALAWAAAIAILVGNAYGAHVQRVTAGSETDDLRGAVRYLGDRWRPGDAVLINAGYAYTAFEYYYTAPTAGRLRLTDYRSPGDPSAPLVLQTGIIGGAAGLGWGDPGADFYATTASETTAALARVLADYPRLWVLRIYDTVADPAGEVREWLTRETIPFEDRAFTGSSYPRVQGYMARHQPAPPPMPPVALQGDMTLVGSHTMREATPGVALDVVLWWQVTGPAVSQAPPRAVSLKLWQTGTGQTTPLLAAQADEWPLGSLLLTPGWPPGVVLRHPMRLRLPPDLAAGVYRLEVQMYDPTTLLPYARLKGEGSSVLLGEIQVTAAQAP